MQGAGRGAAGGKLAACAFVRMRSTFINGAEEICCTQRSVIVLPNTQCIVSDNTNNTCGIFKIKKSHTLSLKFNPCIKNWSTKLYIPVNL